MYYKSSYPIRQTTEKTPPGVGGMQIRPKTNSAEVSTGCGKTNNKQKSNKQTRSAPQGPGSWDSGQPNIIPTAGAAGGVESNKYAGDRNKFE